MTNLEKTAPELAEVLKQPAATDTQVVTVTVKKVELVTVEARYRCHVPTEFSPANAFAGACDMARAREKTLKWSVIERNQIGDFQFIATEQPK